MRFERVDYRKHRDRILPIIQRAEKDNEHEFADEIDEALLDDRAFLFLCADGLIVLQPTVKDGLIWVNIMFAFSWGTTALPCYMNEIFTLARKIGARGVELYTVIEKERKFLIRKGFHKDSGDNRIQHWIKKL